MTVRPTPPSPAPATQSAQALDVCVSTRAGSRMLRLCCAGALVVGRDPECGLRLEGHRVSRRHAVIRAEREQLSITDQSRNGTHVDGRRLHRETTRTTFGVPIHVGEYTLAIVPATPSPPPPSGQCVDAACRRPAGSGARPGPVTPGSAADADGAAHATVDPAPSFVPVAVPAAQLRREIHRRLIDTLELSTLEPSRLDQDPSLRPRVLAALAQIVEQLGQRIPDGTDRQLLVTQLADEALGLGPLEQVLADPTVTEVMVVGPDAVYVERGGIIHKTEARFTDEERVRAVIERIVAPLGRRIDEASPLVDARLSDGARVNVVIRPLALNGSCITIRKFTRAPLTLEQLYEHGSLSPQMGRFLTRTVLARKNILVSGGTSSGKTTLLGALSAAIPEHERIITIEDAAELRLHQPHVVSLETRPANLEGKGELGTRVLVRNAMRMRPDRIVVGECRGGEALDMLCAMNTGHDGSLTTTHANSAGEAVARLETLALMGGVDLPARAIREQIATSLHLIVHQQRFADGSRKVSAITEVVGMGPDGHVQLRPIFRFCRTRFDARGKITGEFQPTGYLPSYLGQFTAMGLVRSEESLL
jgi:pilus assembly protein CpaF